MNPQVTALLIAIAGGFFMGLYPLFIKTAPVLAAKPHPVVFQLYKSSIVFLTGWLFLIPRALRTLPEGEPLYEFSIYGIMSAAFWVPSGLLTIASVPMIGMGMQVAISCAANAVLSFLVFWLVFGSEMKQYSCGADCTYYRAPIYLSATVLGMISLIFSQKIAGLLGCGDAPAGRASRSEKEGLLGSVNGGLRGSVNYAPIGDQSKSVGTFVLGFCLAIGCGIFAAAQYAVLNPAEKFTMSNAHCGKKETPQSSDACKGLFESFDHVGSWLVSFGIGAILVTLTLLALVCAQRRLTGKTAEDRAMPSLHWNVLKHSGVAAGCSWALANFLIITANVIGGNAVVMAQTLSAQIITSGLFGILWYGEGGGSGSKAVWGVSAVFTLVSMVLLGLEKVASENAGGHTGSSGSGSW